MGHNQHGQTLLGQLQYYVQHFSNHFRVQRCGNLIKEHDFRVHAERTDNGHPLLLATGELTRVSVLFLQQSHPLQQSLSLSLHPFFLPLLYFDGGEGDVVQNGFVGKQIIALKYHADTLTDLGQSLGLTGNGLSVQCNGTCVDGFQSIDAAEQGALSTAGGAKDHCDLPLLNGEIQSV